MHPTPSHNLATPLTPFRYSDPRWHGYTLGLTRQHPSHGVRVTHRATLLRGDMPVAVMDLTADAYRGLSVLVAAGHSLGSGLRDLGAGAWQRLVHLGEAVQSGEALGIPSSEELQALAVTAAECEDAAVLARVAYLELAAAVGVADPDALEDLESQAYVSAHRAIVSATDHSEARLQRRGAIALDDVGIGVLVRAVSQRIRFQARDLGEARRTERRALAKTMRYAACAAL